MTVEDAKARQAQLQALQCMFIYALRHTMQESAEAATRGLLRLGAQPIVEDLLDRYNRDLPPFQGAKGRFRKVKQ